MGWGWPLLGDSAILEDSIFIVVALGRAGLPMAVSSCRRDH